MARPRRANRYSSSGREGATDERTAIALDHGGVGLLDRQDLRIVCGFVRSPNHHPGHAHPAREPGSRCGLADTAVAVLAVEEEA